MMWTIPNVLTIGRILAAPCMALVFVLFDRPLADWLAIGLFSIAAITDFFDGWLARRLDQVTELGKMLDPIADKLLVMTALLVIAAETVYRWEYFVPIVLILFREIFVSGLREFMGGVALSVTRLAKFKTAFQMSAIFFVLSAFAAEYFIDASFRGSLEPDALDSIQQERQMMQQVVVIAKPTGIALLWLSAAVTIITGLDYFRKTLGHLHAQNTTKDVF